MNTVSMQSLLKQICVNKNFCMQSGFSIIRRSETIRNINTDRTRNFFFSSLINYTKKWKIQDEVTWTLDDIYLCICNNDLHKGTYLILDPVRTSSTFGLQSFISSQGIVCATTRKVFFYLECGFFVVLY